MASMNDRDGLGGRRRGDPRLRAADADRDAAAGMLRRHYTEGRLDAGEYNERVERCYAAKTMGELDDLFTDLPSAAAREPERSRRAYPPLWRLAVVAPIIVALIVICAVTGAHLIWLAFPLIFLIFRYGRAVRLHHTGGERF